MRHWNSGANVGVWGANHTWFITAILLCYILPPPVIAKLVYGAEEQKKVELIEIGIPLIPFLLNCFSMEVIYMIGTPVCFYALAYILGRKFKNGYRFPKNRTVLYIGIVLAAFGVRILGRMLFDGTRIYNHLIASYTQYIAAFALIAIFGSLLSGVGKNKIVDRIGKISFEIYLYHYMLVVGPISLMKITGSWGINSVLVVVVTIIIAGVMERVGEMVMGRVA